MTVLFYCILIINSFAFVLTGYDKRLAIKNKRRVSEKTLLSIVAFGGTVGAGIAMGLFRHKTAKRSFLFKYFGILLIQVLLLYYYCKL
ncbi:DUF1294 domain-containing protein [Flavobacterium sp. K5-23]|uniref:DUF1294 domain-containing protein n=1 Tax=Flavobacterium sp. K5-23 TaxID=2746225 RepID=UPI00200FAB36|nr:DUF1294 domain-containing protein [Flavobacterium sp. K5-23]UQD55575.1 DUF1294 domain-containing protein [Flavobacterium sp. K5-23]